MAASPFLSKHLPGVSGGTVQMVAADAGVAIVNTGLREVAACTANVKADTFTADEESVVGVNYAPTTGATLTSTQVRLVVEKGGTNHGDAADSAVDVSFIAIGDR